MLIMEFQINIKFNDIKNTLFFKRCQGGGCENVRNYKQSGVFERREGLKKVLKPSLMKC